MCLFLLLLFVHDNICYDDSPFSELCSSEVSMKDSNNSSDIHFMLSTFAISICLAVFIVGTLATTGVIGVPEHLNSGISNPEVHPIHFGGNLGNPFKCMVDKYYGFDNPKICQMIKASRNKRTITNTKRGMPIRMASADLTETGNNMNAWTVYNLNMKLTTFGEVGNLSFVACEYTYTLGDEHTGSPTPYKFMWIATEDLKNVKFLKLTSREKSADSALTKSLRPNENFIGGVTKLRF